MDSTIILKIHSIADINVMLDNIDDIIKHKSNDNGSHSHFLYTLLTTTINCYHNIIKNLNTIK